MKCMFCDKELVKFLSGEYVCFHGNHHVGYYVEDGSNNISVLLNYHSEKYCGYRASLINKTRWVFYRYNEPLFDIPYVAGKITPENAEQKIKMLLAFV